MPTPTKDDLGTVRRSGHVVTPTDRRRSELVAVELSRSRPVHRRTDRRTQGDATGQVSLAVSTRSAYAQAGQTRSLGETWDRQRSQKQTPPFVTNRYVVSVGVREDW